LPNDGFIHHSPLILHHSATEWRLMFHLAWPWLLLPLPLPWLVRWLLPATPNVGGGTLFVPFTPVLSRAGMEGLEPGRGRSLRWWGALLCWLLLVMAAARPQWLGEPVELPETGRNLLLAVDVSGSMESADLDTSNATRLDVVKQVAGEFIQRREGDRVGLILFGTQAYLQTPLTFDRTTVKTLLEEAVIGIAGRETAIGDAIGMALKRLQDTEGETVLVLLTDGANTAGNVSPLKAAELAAQQGLRIHTIGVGGAPRSVRGLLGMQVVNPASGLDEEALQAIAQVSGGQYFRATDREALQEIYQRLDELEPVTGGSRVVRPVSELYAWPLGMGFVLSLVLALVTWRQGVP
jgi:Ca-activated chloride channel family protein